MLRVLLSIATSSCIPARPASPSSSITSRIHVESEDAAIDAPVGWSVSIHTPRSRGRNPVVWLIPPVELQGRGHIVVVTTSDATATIEPDPTAFLTSIVEPPSGRPAPLVRRIAVAGASIVCVEQVTQHQAATACGEYRALDQGRRALVWAFVQRVEPRFYQTIGGAQFLAECAASLRGFEVIPSPYSTVTPSP